ncbi:MAG: mannose-6-phosphate isomerase-like protein (cupin superfamily) [Mariniblastus sp.]|jgi:mannose-6-phosphate isomerase-like protein (cupin superfamily)
MNCDDSSRSKRPDDSRLTVGNALASLQGEDAAFKTMFEHGTLAIEMYKPVEVDHQTLHSRDEVYVIASGAGMFLSGEIEQAVVVGEVLFVPAGVDHRFFDFTEDFSTWVFFYGPQGGESK